MILEEWERFQTLDSGGMLAEIDGLPDQLQAAWSLGGQLDLPDWEGFRQVMIAGMGGSAIGADLLQAYVAPGANVPIIVWRDYGLPAYASGQDTLFIASSHSGETEEVLSAFEAAQAAGLRTIAVTTGGTLAQQAREQGSVVWQFEHDGQPRAAVGYSFGLLLALISRLQLTEDPTQALHETVGAMQAQQARLAAKVPVVQNPAKRMAGQLMGRWPTIVGADLLEPVARRWRTQISELAKALAQFESLPEADHNMLAGLEEPDSLFAHTMVVFLRSDFNHDRNQLRIDLTRQTMMVEGLNTDVVKAQGPNRMAQQWNSLHFGDYTAFYLAMAYEQDPTPVAALQAFKQELQRQAS